MALVSTQPQNKVKPSPARRRNAAQRLPPARRRSAAILWWSLPAVAIGGWFYPYLGFLMLLCMLAPVVVGAIRGRYWCGWMCPRGSFFDYIMARFSRNKPAPTWLRSKAFRVGMMIFLMGMMGTQITLAWPNPMAIGRVFIMLLGVTTVVGIVLAIAYKPRTWCTFCPMGTMSRWLSHGKRPLHVTSACRDCSACSKLCPMSLTPQHPDHTHADCIKCTVCVGVCPQKAISFEKPDETVVLADSPAQVKKARKRRVQVADEAHAGVCGLPLADTAIITGTEKGGSLCNPFATAQDGIVALAIQEGRDSEAFLQGDGGKEQGMRAMPGVVTEASAQAYASQREQVCNADIGQMEIMLDVEADTAVLSSEAGTEPTMALPITPVSKYRSVVRFPTTQGMVMLLLGGMGLLAGLLVYQRRRSGKGRR